MASPALNLMSPSEQSSPSGRIPYKDEDAIEMPSPPADQLPSNDEKYEETPIPYTPTDPDILKSHYDSTHRELKPRHIQLIGIGG